MIRLRLVVKYLINYPTTGYWATRNDKIPRSQFRSHIESTKLLLQSIWDTFRMWFRKVFLNKNSKNSQTAIDRMHIRLGKIDCLIDKAISRGYIKTSSTNPACQVLFVDWEGKEFVKPIPFMTAVCKEYGDLIRTSLLILGSAGSTLLIVFWNKIIEALLGLL